MRRQIALAASVLLASAQVIAAQEFKGSEYAAKIICGVPDRPALASGAYFTAINVHNPGSDSVRFRQKFALTRAREVPGPIVRDSSLVLGPDQALEIDCTDIARRVSQQQRMTFLKGFAVLQSPSELDVVAVYTAASSRGGTVTVLEIERVAGRHSGGGECKLPDLVVDTILRPTFLPSPSRSRIEVVIHNLGPGFSAASTARLVDPSTLVGGVPQSATAATPPLTAGATATVVFILPYWVFNPDAVLDVTADYGNVVPECREDNNMKHFEAKG